MIYKYVELPKNLEIGNINHITICDQYEINQKILALEKEITMVCPICNSSMTILEVNKDLQYIYWDCTGKCAKCEKDCSQKVITDLEGCALDVDPTELVAPSYQLELLF